MPLPLFFVFKIMLLTSFLFNNNNNLIIQSVSKIRLGKLLWFLEPLSDFQNFL